MTYSTEPNPRQWRRFLRFNLRTLILLTLMFGSGLGWLVHSARVQREAVAAIRRDRDSVLYYNWEWKDGQWIRGGAPAWPHWLVEKFGVDYFGHVVFASLYRPSEAEFAYLGHLTKTLELHYSEVAGRMNNGNT